VDAAGAHDSGVPLTYTGMHLIFSWARMIAIHLRSLPAEAGRPIPSAHTGRHAEQHAGSIALFNNNAGAGASRNVFFNSLSVANFTPITYSINTSSSPSGGGFNQRWWSRKLRVQCDVCAGTNACYQFVNWTEGSNVVSSSFATVLRCLVTAIWWRISAKSITRSLRVPHRRKEERRTATDPRYAVQCDGERSAESWI